jgi:hypothetical protein
MNDVKTSVENIQEAFNIRNDLSILFCKNRSWDSTYLVIRIEKDRKYLMFNHNRIKTMPSLKIYNLISELGIKKQINDVIKFLYQNLEVNK